MQKTSGEIEREFINGLDAQTGKNLEAWLDEVIGSGISKRNDVIAWLKSDCGFGHMNASLLAGIAANGGKPVYGDTRELLENQMSKDESMRPLYERFTEYVAENFPDVIVLPKKTYVSVLVKREFAAINIKKGELRIGLDLGDRPFDDAVGKSKLTGPMPRISHQLTLTDESQFDATLVNLLKESYDRSH